MLIFYTSGQSLVTLFFEVYILGKAILARGMPEAHTGIPEMCVR